VPILTITGHYDGDQGGALTWYREHMRHGNAAARDKHYLIIGPWDHPGTRTPAREVAGLTFGEASLLDMNGLHKAWYDWTMKDGPRPEFLKDRIAYYVVPSDEWKYAGRLDAIAKESVGVDVVAPDPVTVRGDRAALERALSNLVDNARRHGRGRIVVEASASNGLARLSVADEGDGVNGVEAEQVFERFSRGRDHGPGSGLGLALVRATAERHGGRAFANGARFTIELPCLRDVSESVGTTNGEQEKGSS